jgi:tetratricopeptide (TPR) repeat protein
LHRSDELLVSAEGNEPMRANVLTAVAGLHALAGDFTAARTLRAEAEQIYVDLGLRMSVAGLTQIAARIERLAENPAAAEAELRRGIDILRGSGDEALHWAWLAAALVAQGRFGEARTAADEARAMAPLEDVQPDVAWRGALARVHAAAGEIEKASALAQYAVDRASLTDDLVMQAEAWLDLAAVRELAGDAEGASAAVGEARDLYDRKGRITPAAAKR